MASSEMASVKVDDRIKKVMQQLKDTNTRRIVLTGAHGIGKTWTARKVLEKVRKTYGAENNHLDFGFTLWVSMNQKFDKFSLYDKIASQLILPSNEGEKDDDDNDLDQEGQVDESKEKMLEKLKKNIKAKLANRRYLLIMDDEGNGMTDSFLMAELQKVLPTITERNSKILITKTDDDGAPTSEENKISISIEALHKQESYNLLHKIIHSESRFKPQLEAIQPLHKEESYNLPHQIVQSESRFKLQLEAITQICNHLPDQIVVIANLLRFLLDFNLEAGYLDTILEEMVNVNDYQKATDLLVKVFAIIPKLNMKFPVIETADMKFVCSWYGRRIFEASKCSIHYNDLITYWTFEGCLGHVDEIDKAYDAGHSLLLELIELGLLTKHDDNFVSMNRLFVEVKDHRCYGFRGITSLGLENIFQDDIWEGVGRLSKSVAKNKKYNKKVSALLLDSSRLSREVPESLFERFSSLRVLGLFNPSFESIPTSFSSLKQLNVLVIRGCPFLNNVDSIEGLQNLIVLEITGASSLKEIPETLFKNMSRLRTISVSAGNIISVPKISDQLDLRRIILRNCSCLEKVPFIPKSKDLEVIDISGCTSMKVFEDKSFQEFLGLQYLDVSNTQLDSLPLLKKLVKLNRLILSNTPTPRLRFLDDLTGLEIMDISTSKVFKDVKDDVFTNKTAMRVIDFSGTQVMSFQTTVYMKMLETVDLSNNHTFQKFVDASLEHLKHLRVLDISNTSIYKLPNLIKLPNLRRLLLNDCTKLEKLGKMEGLMKIEKIDLSNAQILGTIPNLNHENLRIILLQGCGKLQKLPSLAKVTKLEELDLSGCVSLTEIEDQSFDHLTELKKLKLTKTKICALPSLSALTKLEELDLSGIDGVEAIEGGLILQQMKNLQILNLSGIRQLSLTSVSHLTEIKQLILNGCTDLAQLIDLEKLTKLEILDLTNTKISSLPTLKSFPDLKHLLLRNLLKIEQLSDLEFVKKLEVLDLFGTGLKKFPYEISKLACLTDLSLPEINGCHVDWRQIKWLPEVNIEECGLFKPSETNTGSGSNGELSIKVTSDKLFKFFKEFPNLWETYFKKFQISVCSPEYITDRDPLLSGPEADMFRDIYTIHTTKSIDHRHTRCLDIRGFDTISSSLDGVLSYAEFVSITDNTSEKSLQIVGAGNMKRLWIERCNKLENIFNVEEADAGLVQKLEVMCVSNMANLKTIVHRKNEVMHAESFISLREMYLDCCPELVTLFTSGKTPENLEVIDIKFCDKLEAVFGETTCEMKKLHTLRLLQLPQLKTVGYKLKSVEKLDTVIMEYCGTLEKFSEEASGLELPSLRELHLQSLPMLKHIGSVQTSPLDIKHVEDCPELNLG